MPAIFTRVFCLSVIVVGLIACAASPAPRFYLLEPQSSPALAKGGAAQKLAIGIGPLSIPALLDRKQIVTRTGQNTVEIAEFHQWAEPFHDSIAQTLTQNLSVLQPYYVIRTYPWSAYGTVNYRVLIDIDRFDTRPGLTVNLEARWSVMDEKSGAILFSRQTSIEHRLADPSYPAAVKALSITLHEFSRELALAFDRLN